MEKLELFVYVFKKQLAIYKEVNNDLLKPIKDIYLQSYVQGREHQLDMIEKLLKDLCEFYEIKDN